MRRVAVVYKFSPQYRQRFWELLRGNLEEHGIHFDFLYGEPGAAAKSKGDLVEISWGIKIPQKIWSVWGHELIWQPILKRLAGYDLIIVEHAGKLLLNYLLLLRQSLGGPPVAFWGHGHNFQVEARIGPNEWVKRKIARWPHWWFAYNELSAQVVRNTGFPADRITPVQNAIDTRLLIEARERLSPTKIEEKRAELGIRSDRVAIYIGGMYKEKRLEYLLRCCHCIRGRVPDFEVIFLGGGPDAHLVQAAAEQNPWIHYVGPKFNEQKVPYAALSRCMLMPGLVGLAIIDTFALEVPMITTEFDSHSPEIEYLKNGENGLMLPNDGTAETYAKGVAEVMLDDALHVRLVEGCRRAQSTYTVEEMAHRFAVGVEAALRAPRR